MPIIIPKDIPAYEVLTKENIFVMGSTRASAQDIRPLEIAIVNLMPTKVETETQLMRMLSNSPLQVNVTLIKTASYNATNVSEDHMTRFYKVFDEVKDFKFDGMIVTGAPVETMDFTDVKYWEELCAIMDYADKSVTSAVFICWGAQAALNYYYGIDKIELKEKVSGVFDNHVLVPNEPLLRGLNDTFRVPHSRHTVIDEEKLKQDKRLVALATGEECGLSIAKSADDKKFFFFGHFQPVVPDHGQHQGFVVVLFDILEGRQCQHPFRQSSGRERTGSRQDGHGLLEQKAQGLFPDIGRLNEPFFDIQLYHCNGFQQFPGNQLGQGRDSFSARIHLDPLILAYAPEIVLR